MTVYDFTRNWTVEAEGRPATAVTFPHDAMIHERRDGRCRNGANTGYFPGGVYTYRKTFAGPEEWRGAIARFRVLPWSRIVPINPVLRDLVDLGPHACKGGSG
jgi:hypothetical protein